jgi:hypothetical protein
MTITSKLSLVAGLMLLVAAQAAAAEVSATEGDYYAPSNTVVQQPTAAQTKQAEEGDFYASGKTIVQQPTAPELKQAEQGDFYAPKNGN